MNDDQLDQLIRDHGPEMRAAPPLDTARLWQRVERARRERRPGTQPLLLAAAMAASLLVGIGIGRTTGARATPDATVADAPAPTARLNRPIERTATALLGETVALLSALPTTPGDRDAAIPFGRQAQELLVTTRLLLDAGVAGEPRLVELLQDLELVLSQIARLEHRPTQTELELINEALEDRELMPRIRRVAATLAADD